MMHLLIVFLLLVNVRSQQYPCTCTCCNGQSCNPTVLPNVYVQYCTLETCLAQCRATYGQCQGNYPNGHISAECGITVIPQYNCRCECCNTGSVSCTPSYVGNSQAYSCQTGACSIACSTQYPYQCVSNQNGRTQGTCIGYAATTSTTTSVGPWLGNTCLCMCCNTGSFCSPTYVGTTSTSQCSSVTCTQACRNRYSLSCPSYSSIGQTNGICTSDSNGNTRCNCRCCSSNSCSNYEVRINGDCAMCDSMCRQRTPCVNTIQVTYTCQTNNAKLYFPWMIFILTITLSSNFTSQIESFKPANDTQFDANIFCLIIEPIAELNLIGPDVPSSSLLLLWFASSSLFSYSPSSDARNNSASPVLRRIMNLRTLSITIKDEHFEYTVYSINKWIENSKENLHLDQLELKSDIDYTISITDNNNIVEDDLKCRCGTQICNMFRDAKKREQHNQQKQLANYTIGNDINITDEDQLMSSSSVVSSQSLSDEIINAPISQSHRTNIISSLTADGIKRNLLSAKLTNSQQSRAKT